MQKCTEDCSKTEKENNYIILFVICLSDSVLHLKMSIVPSWKFKNELVKETLNNRVSDIRLLFSFLFSGAEHSSPAEHNHVHS